MMPNYYEKREEFIKVVCDLKRSPRMIDYFCKKLGFNYNESTEEAFTKCIEGTYSEKQLGKVFDTTMTYIAVCKEHEKKRLRQKIDALDIVEKTEWVGGELVVRFRD